MPLNLDNLVQRAAAATRDSTSSSSSSTSSTPDFVIQNDYIKLPKFRTLEDFLLQADRYSIPNHGNTDRFNNRVLNNLLYYQTNYIATFLCCFTMVCILQPKAVLLGSVFVGGILLGGNWVIENRDEFENLRENRQGILFFGGIIVWDCFIFGRVVL